MIYTNVHMYDCFVMVDRQIPDFNALHVHQNYIKKKIE